MISSPSSFLPMSIRAFFAPSNKPAKKRKVQPHVNVSSPTARLILANAAKLGKAVKFETMPKHSNCWYIFIRDIRTLSKADFKALWDSQPVEKKRVQIGSESREENRKSQFFNGDGTGWFKYSGLLSQASAIVAGGPIDQFLNLTNQLMRSSQGEVSTSSGGKSSKSSSSSSSSVGSNTHNSVLVNWYEPQHTIGAHADDESQHQMDIPIFSYSLGGTRRFVFHPKAGGEMVKDITLNNGDLIIMGGKMQQHFKHSVPHIRRKDSFERRNRINLTCRAFQEQKKK